jgi:formyl-CoA transferase
LLSRPQADGSSLLVPGIVPKLSRTPGAHLRDAPGLGQDTDAVLKGMGLSEAQIAELRAKGVVQ